VLCPNVLQVDNTSCELMLMMEVAKQAVDMKIEFSSVYAVQLFHQLLMICSPLEDYQSSEDLRVAVCTWNMSFMDACTKSCKGDK